MSIERRGDSFRARVHDRTGKVLSSRTFPSLKEAKDWFAVEKATIRSAMDYQAWKRTVGAKLFPEPKPTFLRDILIRYRDEVADHQRGWVQTHNRLNRLIQD